MMFTMYMMQETELLLSGRNFRGTLHMEDESPDFTFGQQSVVHNI